MTEPNHLPARLKSSRPDRWTKAKMAQFLRELAACHSVAAAARSVGMSRQSAYRLRNRLKSQSFDIAWETAFQHSYDALAHAALERALYGVEVPVWHKGEQVGVRRHFDERLTCFLLSARNRAGAQQLGRYRSAADFWSERWDRLLWQVENGGVEWEGYQNDDNEAERLSNVYTAPDPLPAEIRAEQAVRPARPSRW